MTLRVLYSFPHTLGTVGINSTAWWQVRGLLEHGAEVSVFCSSLARDLGPDCEVVQTMAIGGRRVPHRALGSVEAAYQYHDWRVERALRRRKDQIDLVHCWPAACRRTLATARQLGILSFRESPSAHTEAAYQRAAEEARSVGVTLPWAHPLRFNDRRLAREKHEFESADVVLVPSTAAEQTFIERGFPADRLARHQYGFDPMMFWPAERRASPRPFTAAFVGRGEPNKGLHYALRAWLDSGVAGHGRFVICGRILPAYRAVLSPMLDHPSVVERGFVDDVPAVLRDADVLLLPSVTEGSALVTFEAQGAGCVLLVSDAAGAQCVHMQDALVHPAGDLEMLTNHIRMVATDQPLLTRLRAATIVHRAELTWDRAADRLLKAYNLCLSGRRS